MSICSNPNDFVRLRSYHGNKSGSIIRLTQPNYKPNIKPINSYK